MALAEANAEMDVKISTLAAQLSEAKQLHEEARYSIILSYTQYTGSKLDWIIFLESY